MFDVYPGWDFDAVGGLTSGADPVGEMHSTTDGSALTAVNALDQAGPR